MDSDKLSPNGVQSLENEEVISGLSLNDRTGIPVGIVNMPTVHARKQCLFLAVVGMGVSAFGTLLTRVMSGYFEHRFSSLAIWLSVKPYWLAPV